MDERHRTCATPASSISLTALPQQNNFQEFLGTRLGKSDRKLLFLLLENYFSVPDNPVQNMHKHAAHLFKRREHQEETYLLFQQNAADVLFKHLQGMRIRKHLIY